MSQPPINRLPFTNLSFLEILFSELSLDLIVTLFANLLLERSILVVSTRINHLAPITMGLAGLLVPFEWITCIPFLWSDTEDLDLNQLNIITSPHNYIIGIHVDDLDKALQLLLMDGDAEPIIVELHNGEEEYPHNADIRLVL